MGAVVELTDEEWALTVSFVDEEGLRACE